MALLHNERHLDDLNDQASRRNRPNSMEPQSIVSKKHKSQILFLFYWFNITIIKYPIVTRSKKSRLKTIEMRTIETIKKDRFRSINSCLMNFLHFSKKKKYFQVLDKHTHKKKNQCILIMPHIYFSIQNTGNERGFISQKQYCTRVPHRFDEMNNCNVVLLQ